MKKLFLIAVVLTVLFSKPACALADTSVSDSSAQLVSNIIPDENPDETDYRVLMLKEFFDRYNSPLSNHAQSFIIQADNYSLDWRLVPAITGVESTFGKRIPQNSYNAYGWANGAYYFDSWDQSISVVSKTLKEKYIENGADSLNEIARRYAPPSSTWAFKVKYFMDKIDPLPLTFTI